MPAEGLRAGGVTYALPPDARPLPALPLRPVPLAVPELLGIAMLGGQAVPVLAAAAGLPGGDAWVLLDTPDGRLIVAAEAMAEAPEGAPPLAPPRIAARAAVAEPPVPPAPAEASWTVPLRGSLPRQMRLAAEIGGCRLVLPFAMLDRVVAMPTLRPAPGTDRCALGYAVADGAAVLVLDPAWLAGGQASAPGPRPNLLVLFHHAGRRLGLPCDRVGPARPGEPTLLARLEAADLAAAPAAEARPAVAAEATCSVLVCGAGQTAFALPVEAVSAVIAPLSPTGVPNRAPGGRLSGVGGIVAHRGDVLPVLDAGVRLGLAPVLVGAGADAPLLRLAGDRPVALAVSAVAGLRRIPLRLVADVPGRGIVAAIAALPDGPLPICRAAVLGRLP